ncbi:hypothetical protein SDC9_126503 [bioreactor metagenome]|uniref:Uncharacterized protein n=1 Tax=bioreactor metagenome TaxID=1076179 RepID=A0A645CRE4_9ZZZZ
MIHDRIVCDGEHLGAVVGDDQGLLELRTDAAVLGEHGPVVVPLVPVVAAEGDHRLDRERHPRLDHRGGERRVVVRDDQAGMEGGVHAVAGVVADHAVAEPLGVLLDGEPDDVDATSGLHHLDRPVHRRLRPVHQVDHLGGDVTTEERVAVVTVHAVLVCGDVDLDDVTVLERALVRDPVTDDLVHRGADRLGEAPVVERGRVGAVVAHVLVSDPVERVRRDPGCHRTARLVHRVGGDPADLAHLLDGLGALHVGARVHIDRGVVLRLVGVLGPVDAGRHMEDRGHGILLHGRHVAQVTRRTIPFPVTSRGRSRVVRVRRATVGQEARRGHDGWNVRRVERTTGGMRDECRDGCGRCGAVPCWNRAR